MKETVNISIGGFAFILETDAYQRLKKYTEILKTYFSAKVGGDEVIQDIESRIAEIFKEKLKGREVVLLADVTEMIEIMGEPEVFMEQAEGLSSKENSEGTGNSNPWSDDEKRLFRDPDNKILGGVCAGAANYLSIDPIWFRLAFVTVFFLFGSGFLLYIILWAIIPEAKTTAQKLQMKGKKVNLSNIEKSIKEDLENFGKKAENFAKSSEFKSTAKNLGGFFEELITMILKVFSKILIGVFKVASVFVIAICTILLIGLLITLFTGGGLQLSNNHTIGFGTGNEFLAFIFGNDEYQWLALIGLFLFIGIPAIALIYHSVRLLANIKTSSKIFSLVATTLWIIGLGICIYIGVRVGTSFKEKTSNKSTEDIFIPKSQTLWIKASSFDVAEVDEVDQEGNYHVSNVHLDIRSAAPDSTFKLQIIKSSRGYTESQASLNLKKIMYKYLISDSIITFSNHYTLQKGDVFRDQSVMLKLLIPEGGKIHLSESVLELLYDIDNVDNYHDSDMVNHTWEMTSSGLKCLDCK
jgi:phage shock protein PspC (stress-responsive transcriptional regulator)